MYLLYLYIPRASTYHRKHLGYPSSKTDIAVLMANAMGQYGRRRG